jgi:serine/threonine protein kinase
MTIVGTYGYMPPEQFSGRAFPASDLYSLGATLIYLVTGTHPADLLQEDLLLEFEPVTHLSSSFVQWLKLLTHPNRKQRLTSTTFALKALEQPFFQSQPIESSTTSTPLTLQKHHDSKVSLRKDSETLEIYVPPENCGGAVGCTFLFFWVLIAMGLSSVCSGNVFGILIGLLFLWIGIYGQCEAFFTAKADRRIYIDGMSLSVTETAFGIRRRVFHASRNNLYKLTYCKRLYRQDSEAGIVEVPPELKIWTKHFDPLYRDISYRIGQSRSADSKTRFYGCLTTQELDWLAQELSNWLELPITRE